MNLPIPRIPGNSMVALVNRFSVGYGVLKAVLLQLNPYVGGSKKVKEVGKSLSNCYQQQISLLS